MIVQSVSTQPVQASGGQYVSETCCFRSDDDNTGKVVFFSPALFTNSALSPTITNFAFKEVYPAIGTNVEMTNFGLDNYKAFIESIDEYNFCITIEFIVGNSANGWALDNQTLTLLYYLRVDSILT